MQTFIRSTRGGKLNDSKFGRRQVGTGNIAEMIADTFRIWCMKLGFVDDHPPLNADAFRPPTPTTGCTTRPRPRSDLGERFIWVMFGGRDSGTQRLGVLPAAHAGPREECEETARPARGGGEGEIDLTRGGWAAIRSSGNGGVITR